MTSSAKIALVTVWFGDWRGWINLNLESCARNPDITWFFLHDQPAPPAHQPANVHFVSTSLAEIASRYQHLTGRAIALTTPYKACDLKPLLGPMFPELLTGYEWWGYCDTDLLWGNLRHFLTDDVLARHDIITSHVCAIVGQFTIFRGVDLPRKLTAEIPDIDALFADPKYRGVDELLIDKAACAREARGELRVSRRMVQVWERLYEPSWETWASELETKRLGRSVEIHFPLGPCEWRDGHIYHLASGQEMMFFHFLEWKRHWHLPLYPWPLRELQSIGIDERGFHFTFGRKNSLRNFRLRFGYEIPYRVTRPLKHYAAKTGRGWRKILRAARLSSA